MCLQPPSPRRRRAVATPATRPSWVLRQPRPKGQNANYSCHSRNKQVNARKQRKNEKEPYFGHGPGEVPKEWFRIGSLNVDNISPWGNDDKDARLCNFLRDCQIEACLIQEVGVKWNKTRRKRQWSRRCAKFSNHPQCKHTSGLMNTTHQVPLDNGEAPELFHWEN